MYYVLLVSHGEMAPGLHTAVKMIAGDNEWVMSAGLHDGSSADDLAAEVKRLLQGVTADDRLVVLADLMGGSPLTTAMKVVAEMGLLTNTVALAGMNLPMALTAVLAGPDVELDMLAETLSGEACNGVEEFVIPADEDEDEEL